MKDTKHQFVRCAFYDQTAMQQQFEKMASQGWLIDKISACFWTFKRIEPANLNITVTYFPSASEFDPGPVIQVNTIWRSDSTLDTYLVCWDNRIVVIKFYWNPTPEQIAIVVEKLKN